MNKTLHIFESLGSLVDIAPTPKPVKRMKHFIDLKYERSDSDILDAWSDSGLLIAESFNALVINEKIENNLNSLKKHQLKSTDSLKVFEKYKFDERVKCIINENDRSMKKLDLSNKIAWDELSNLIESLDNTVCSKNKFAFECRIKP